MQKLIIGGMVFGLCVLGWRNTSMGAQPIAPRGELHIVDNHNFNWTWMVLNVFEYLIELTRKATWYHSWWGSFRRKQRCRTKMRLQIIGLRVTSMRVS